MARSSARTGAPNHLLRHPLSVRAVWLEGRAPMRSSLRRSVQIAETCSLGIPSPRASEALAASTWRASSALTGSSSYGALAKVCASGSSRRSSIPTAAGTCSALILDEFVSDVVCLRHNTPIHTPRHLTTDRSAGLPHPRSLQASARDYLHIGFRQSARQPAALFGASTIRQCQ